MERSSIAGQTALVTGASSGIGKACAEQLAALGVKLVIAARRLERIEKTGEELSAKHGVKVFPVQLDVQSHEQVLETLKTLDSQKIEIDILINNAGLALTTDLMQEADVKNWDTMIDTNIKGLLYVTRAFLPSMVKRNRGHIVNIGSIAGHGTYRAGNVYSATKHAVRAISQSMRIDLMGTALRVSEVDPGAVETEFSEVRWNDKERAKKLYEGFDPLVADDIADAVCYCLTRPPHVNIAEIIVFPQAQASMNDLYRKGEPIKSLLNPEK